MSYQQGWDSQRYTYQTGYRKDHGSGSKPSCGGYRRGWRYQSSGSQRGPAMRPEIVQGGARNANQGGRWGLAFMEEVEEGREEEEAQQMLVVLRQ